jgi:S1-C subfamily serine protease
MRKALLLGALFVSVFSPVHAQVERAMLKVRVMLFDGDLNQKPVPRLLLKVERADGISGETVTARTGFDGTLELALAPGRYRVTTPDGIEFQSRRYRWNEEITVSAPSSSLDLSNDNAIVPPLSAPVKPARGDDLAELFRKYQNSVVTVWSEIGHGTGFIVDAESGLILTNHHVIGTTEYAAVQFDEKRKVAAQVVAFDVEADIAVLRANLEAFPEAIAAPLAKSTGRRAAVSEGDRVFTIGSPLNQRKIMTSGLVSKVETRVILSDIRINHGNSGGPLFTMAGTVVGLTTFLDEFGAGEGISGIVRIEQAELLLERARTKMRDMAAPVAGLLPVEPAGTFPLDALKSALEARKFDEDPYVFRQGDYDVAIVTPILKYRLTQSSRMKEQAEKEKRTSRTERAIKGTFRPLDDFKNWADSLGEYKPVIQIEASPRLGRDIGLHVDLSRLKKKNANAVRMKFKADFYRMKLFCGTREIEPINPGKAAKEIDYHTSSYEIADATFVGVYLYPYDAISSDCSDVTLQLFSEKEPDKPVSKVLDAKTVARVTEDFQPFRKQVSGSRTAAGATK